VTRCPLLGAGGGVVTVVVTVVTVVLVLTGVVVDDVVLVAWSARAPGVEILGPELLPHAASARTPTVVSTNARVARRRVAEGLNTGRSTTKVAGSQL
jgi:hypothetical protein